MTSIKQIAKPSVTFILVVIGQRLKVLQGGPLNASDKFGFDLPPITSANDWQKLVTKVLTEAELLAGQISLIKKILNEIGAEN
jgi:hypothetical protein